MDDPRRQTAFPPVRRRVVVPIRSFDRAKSRLASALDSDQRRTLARICAERVLTLAGVERSVVVCDDPEVARWASELNVDVLRVDSTGLNPSLQEAMPRIMATWKPSEVVVVHADLVFPDALQDLDALLPGDASARVVIVPDRHGDGTNVLGLGSEVVAMWRFAYGPRSFEAHCDQARKLGADLQIVEHSDLSIDLDTPEDLAIDRVRAFVELAITGADERAEQRN